MDERSCDFDLALQAVWKVSTSTSAMLLMSTRSSASPTSSRVSRCFASAGHREQTRQHCCVLTKIRTHLNVFGDRASTDQTNVLERTSDARGGEALWSAPQGLHACAGQRAEPESGV